jgi:hypothetical protein
MMYTDGTNRTGLSAGYVAIYVSDVAETAVEHHDGAVPILFYTPRPFSVKVENLRHRMKWRNVGEREALPVGL